MKIKDKGQNKASTTLGVVDLDVAKAAVLASLRSPGSRRCYEHAIAEFIDWYCSEPRLGFNKIVVTRYRMHLESRGLASGTVNLRLAAVRRLAYEPADSGLLSPEQAASIRRVKGAKKLGVARRQTCSKSRFADLQAAAFRNATQTPKTEAIPGSEYHPVSS